MAKPAPGPKNTRPSGISGASAISLLALLGGSAGAATDSTLLCTTKLSHELIEDGTLYGAPVTEFAKGMPQLLFRVDLRNGALAGKDKIQHAEPFGPGFGTGTLRIATGVGDELYWQASWISTRPGDPGVQFLRIQWVETQSGTIETAPFLAWNGEELYSGVCIIPGRI